MSDVIDNRRLYNVTPPGQYGAIDTFSENISLYLNSRIRPLFVQQFVYSSMTQEISLPSFIPTPGYPRFTVDPSNNTSLYILPPTGYTYSMVVIDEVLIEFTGFTIRCHEADTFFDNSPSPGTGVYIYAAIKYDPDSDQNAYGGLISDSTTVTNDPTKYCVLAVLKVNVDSSGLVTEVTDIITEDPLIPVIKVNTDLSADAGWIGTIPPEYVGTQTGNPGCIRLKRGTDANTANNTPNIGEYIYAYNSNRLLVGDGTIKGGHDVLKGNRIFNNEKSFYGTDSNNRRGFHDLSENSTIDVDNFTIDSATSLYVTSTALGNVPVLAFDPANIGRVYGTLKIPNTWNKDHDVRFRIAYTDETGNGSGQVDLNVKIWLVKNNAAPAVGSPDYSYSEIMYCTSGETLISLNLSDVRVSASDVDDDTEMIVVMVERNASSGDDTYTGLFRLISINAYQVEAGQDYGFVVGGINSSSTTISTTERIFFPFSSATAAQSGNIGAALYNSAQGFNSSVAGYVAFGYSSSNLSTIRRYVFPFQSSDTASELGNGYYATNSSCNSSSRGYIMGGVSAAGTFYDKYCVQDINFAHDSGNVRITSSDVLPVTYRSVGVNSSTHGFGCGGQGISSIYRITFPFDSGSASITGTLNNSADSSAGCNSSTNGYIMGGYAAATVINNIDRITFPFASGTATNSANLNVSRALCVGMNSSTHGFAMNGITSTTKLSTVERFLFSIDGTVGNSGITLTAATHSSSFDGTDFTRLFN